MKRIILLALAITLLLASAALARRWPPGGPLVNLSLRIGDLPGPGWPQNAVISNSGDWVVTRSMSFVIHN